MKNLSIKLLVLVSTLLLGLATFYIFHFLGFSFLSSQNDFSTSKKSVKQTLRTEVNSSNQLSFRNIHSCEKSNSFQNYITKPKGTIDGGIVNHRVICGNLPKRINNVKDFSKSIRVDILIDQFGEVKNAEVKNENQSLEKSILESVYQTRFAPSLLGGESVRVRGILIYRFDSKGSLRIPGKSQIPD